MSKTAVARRPNQCAYVPHKRVVLECLDESRARQEFKDECDINVLMKRYEKTGVYPFPTEAPAPRYLDCTEVPNIMEAMQIMIDAEAAFMTLPAHIRASYGLDNDPVKFVEFASDPKNLDRMREWGLAPPAKEPEPPVKVQVMAMPEPIVAAGGVPEGVKP